MSTKRNPSQQTRNPGVDALRCAAMLLIVCLHVMNRGGALPAGGSPAALLLYPLRVLASSAVNVYALISGYVLLRGRFRPARILALWLQVWVLNVVIGLIGDGINPEAMDTAFWIRYLFPFTQKAYWYFTAYVGVYAFSPLINRGIRALDRVRTVALLWMMLLLFSLCTTLGYLNQGDPYGIGKGYSVLWLLTLYTVGACVRQAELFRRTPAWRLLLVLLLCLGGMTWLYGLGYGSGAPAALRNLNGELLEYTSPLTTAVSLLLLLLFSRLRVGPRAGRLIAWFSPLTFGVYVIHVHHVFWIPLQNAFRFLTELPALLLPLGVVGCALAIFLACAGIDWLRALLFRALRVDRGTARLEAAARRLLDRIIKESNGS